MSGTQIAKAWVGIEPSASGLTGKLEKELQPLAKAGDDAGDKAGRGFAASFRKHEQGLADFGKKALIGATALGVGLFGAARAAGDLSAAIAANEQVLGSASRAVQSWAANSVESVGLSKRAALEAATSFGQLGKVAGLAGQDLVPFSTNLVTLAADLAAFANVPADQAVQDLQAAFQGSTETMQKYNVFLNETELKAALFRATGEQVTGVLTSQERVLATNAALWEQTGDIQGQAARESEGLARAQDNAKASLENAAASIGRTAVPAVSSLLGFVAKGAEGFASFDEATGGAASRIAIFATAGLGVAGVAATVASKVGGLVDTFRNMSRNGRLATAALGGVGLALGAGVLAYGLYTASKNKAKAATDTFLAALKAEADGLENASGEAIAYALANEQVQATAKAAGISNQDLARFIRGDTVPAVRDLLEAAQGTQGAGRFLFGANEVDDLAKLSKQLGVSTDDVLKFVDVLGLQRGAFDTASTQFELSTAIIAETTGETAGAAKAADGLGKAFTLAGLSASAAADGLGAVDGKARGTHRIMVDTAGVLGEMGSEFEMARDKASAFTAPLEAVFG